MRKLVVAAVAITLLATACSGGADEEVGRVGDRAFTTQDLIDLYEDDFFPGDAVTVTEDRRSDLFRLTAIEALAQAAAADFGIALTVDDPSVTALFDERMADIDANEITVADFLSTPGASEQMLRLNSFFGVLRREVINELLSDEQLLRDIYEDGRGVTTVCTRHILVATQADLDVVVERLESGEDFAAVANEVSLDGSPGGDLGCALASRYVEPFARAAVDGALGELVYPIETEFGFHVVVTDERTAPTFEEVLSSPVEFVPSTEADFLWQDWFNAALQDADVTVSEKFGTWTPVGILPPE